MLREATGPARGPQQRAEGRPRWVLVLLLTREAGHEEQLEQLGGPGVVPGQLARSSAWTVASPPLGLGVGQGAPADAG